jgi:hypothetical protein
MVEFQDGQRYGVGYYRVDAEKSALRWVRKHVVGKAALSARSACSTPRGTARMNLPGSEIQFLTDLIGWLPCVTDGMGDVAGADFLFGQVFFVHRHTTIASSSALVSVGSAFCYAQVVYGQWGKQQEERPWIQIEETND